MTKPRRLLHLAPEQAFAKRFRAMGHLDYVTADLNSPLADIKADICNLPFEDHSFDCVLCNHVLEHIPDDKRAMSELFRVMKPGGFGVFQVPLDRERKATFEDPGITDKAERVRLFGQYDHVRVYGMDYFDRLRQVGFKVEAIDYTSELHPEEIDRYRLAEGELIPVVFKN